MEGKIMRKFGEILIYLGTAVLIIWGVVLFFTELPSMPWPLKVAVMLVLLGVVFLVISIANKKKKSQP